MNHKKFYLLRKAVAGLICFGVFTAMMQTAVFAEPVDFSDETFEEVASGQEPVEIETTDPAVVDLLDAESMDNPQSETADPQLETEDTQPETEDTMPETEDTMPNEAEPSLLSAPVLKKAAMTVNGINLLWNPVEGAVYYEIYYKEEPDAEWMLLSAATDTSYQFLKAASGKNYLFTVTAVNSDGRRSLYDEQGISGLYLKSASVKAKKSGETAVLSWKAISGADGYLVFRRLSGESVWTRLGSSKSLTYTDQKIEIGQAYEYTVQSYARVDGKTWKSLLTEDRITSFSILNAPVLKKTAAAASGTKLTWNKTKGAVSYRVYRKKSGKWVAIGDTTARSFVDETAEAGEVYRYTVGAFDKSGIRGLVDSDGIVGVRLSKAAQPQLKNAKKSIQITWEQNGNADGYRLYKKLSSDASWKALKNLTPTSYTDTSVISGRTYQYMAVPYKTVNGKKYYAYKDAASAAEILRLSRPAVAATTSLKKGIRISWDEVEGAVKYKVYRRPSGSGQWECLGKTKKITYTDRTAAKNSLYEYTVKAVSGKTVSASGNSVTGMYPINDPAIVMAQQRLDDCGGTLRAAYNWVVSIPYKDQPDVRKTSGYAQWTFQNRAGDCLGKSAAFVLMARLLGYDCNLMFGSVPRRGGGMTDHGWVEIVIDSVTYVCDPDYENESKNNGYMIQYRQPGTWMYTDYRKLP